jgi:hypothetical protein
MTAAVLVRAAIWLTLPPVRGAAWSLWTAPGLRSRYPAYLATMHTLVRASVPLMEAAVDRCDELALHDPAAAPLARYLTEHIAEELGHDEWLLEDLAVLGPDLPGLVLDTPPPADVAELVGAQYYWIRHYHPACLLGYVAVLEGCAPRPGLTAHLVRETGWPAAAFRTVAGHADLDPGHVRALDDLLTGLPLSPAVATGVARSAAHTGLGATALLRRLARPPLVGRPRAGDQEVGAP